MTKNPISLGLKWEPLPRWAWRLIDAEGRVFKKFHTAEAGQQWLQRNGYVVDEAALEGEG